MNEIVISAESLVKTYGRGTKKVEAVRGIDLQVRKGEIFGLVGPDGAGKTTTIQMLCGILTPTAGSAKVAGADILKNADALGGVIGYMSEGFSLYGSLSVDENIDFFAQLYKVRLEDARERKEKLLRFAHLEEARGRRAEHLSGGMKKKLALACTLIYQPQVLFLDEPTTGVDPASRQDFWKILYEFLAEGITIFVTTHYMDEAEHCNNLGLLYRGRLIARDSPAELRSNMKLGSLLEIPVSDSLAALASLEGTPEIIQTNILGDRLHVLVWDAEASQLSIEQKLASQSLLAGQAQAVPVSLEDLFMLFIEMEEAGRKARQARE